MADSEVVDIILTEDQKNILAECEEEFKNRYTDEDGDYVTYKNFERVKPPIVDPWFKAPFRYNQGRRNQNWGERRYNDRNERNDRNDRHSYHRHGGRHHQYQRQSRPY